MKISRQHERRERFLKTLNTMPRFETWTTYHDDAGYYYLEGGQQITRKKEHVRLIPRCTRRDMARKLSQRQYRVDHNLPEPR